MGCLKHIQAHTCAHAHAHCTHTDTHESFLVVFGMWVSSTFWNISFEGGVGYRGPGAVPRGWAGPGKRPEAV